MSDAPLVILRRLAVRLMHEAQLSPEDSVEGLVGARNGEPSSVHPRNGAITRAELLQKLQAEGETPWAWYRSTPRSPPEPMEADRFAAADKAYSLVVSLNIKGVLELRCWDWASGQPIEREVKVKD